MDSKRILVIDDQVANLLILEILIKDEFQVEVDTTCDVRSALRLVEEYPYSLIIVDLLMPFMNGDVFCKTIRENDIKTPIILLSSSIYEHNSEGTQIKTSDYTGFVSHGVVNSFIMKPVIISELYNEIEKCLNL